MSISSNTGTPVASGKDLMDTAAANDSFKVFGKAVESAGLGATLRGAGPFTVFAPTDAAFDKLPAGKLDSLLKPENKEELVTVLKYHVVNGRKQMADIGKWSTAKTIGGLSAPIASNDGNVSFGGARVTRADIASSNGVIHAIDRVNLPADDTAAK